MTETPTPESVRASIGSLERIGRLLRGQLVMSEQSDAVAVAIAHFDQVLAAFVDRGCAGFAVAGLDAWTRANDSVALLEELVGNHAE